MSNPIQLASNPVIARMESLVASELGKEVVILSVDSGHFFLLNNTASRIWDLLDAPLPLDSITDTLVSRFAVDPDDCRRDVSEFVQVMLERGLLRQTSDQPEREA